mmetsp:Transcript_6014/g.7260  ORF Transcript_6014/g.7260 Transcript_6014/m.7260 type:complete len:110 (+) Transcript_6014:152-481(+)
MSLLILYVTLLFAALKLRHLLERHNPNISTVVHFNALEKDEEFDTTQDSFMMAFAIVDFFDGSLSDPRYIKWVARFNTMDNGDYSTQYVPMEPCKDSDLERFYPIDDRS